MILPFSKQLNGKTTYFVERIWEGLLRNYFQDDKEYIEFMNAHKKRFGIDWDWFPDEHNRLTNPKIHTIREDKKERWQIGTKIDFFINVRQKNMFRFAPSVPVVSIQIFQIIWSDSFIPITIPLIGSVDRYCDIYIDYKFFGDAYFFNRELKSASATIEKFSHNDGFDTTEEFLKYFEKDFTGKIIHWTDLRY